MKDRDIPSLRLLDAIHDNKAFARDMAGRLGNIAAALERLGMMPNVVAELDAIGEDTVSAAERIGSAYGDVQDEQLGHNSQMTANLLQLAMVVIPERAELATLRAEKKL